MQQITELLISYWKEVSGMGVVGLLGFIYNYRKQNQELKIDENNVLKSTQEIYNILTEDVKKRLLDSVERENKLEEMLQKHIETSNKKIEELENYWKKRYDALKKEFEAYKKSHP